MTNPPAAGPEKVSPFDRRPAVPVEATTRRTLMQRARNAASALLPIALMAAAALASWWLLRRAPHPGDAVHAATMAHEPDYVMNGFVAQRYAPDGRLIAQVRGERLRHFPDDDEIRIDTARLRAWSEDGRLTTASAREAVTTSDALLVRLLGGAEVASDVGRPDWLYVNGDDLRIFTRTQRMLSDRPVVVRQGANETHAEGMAYEQATRIVELHGRVTGRFDPPSAHGAGPSMSTGR